MQISGKYIAQPEHANDLKNILPKFTKFADIEGNGHIQLKNNTWLIKDNTIDLKNLKNKLEKKLKKIPYDYMKFKVNKKQLDNTFEKAKYNYFNRLSKIKIKTSWSVDFFVYKNLKIKNHSIDQSKSILLKNSILIIDQIKLEEKVN